MFFSINLYTKIFSVNIFPGAGCARYRQQASAIDWRRSVSVYKYLTSAERRAWKSNERPETLAQDPGTTAKADCHSRCIRDRWLPLVRKGVSSPTFQRALSRGEEIIVPGHSSSVSLNLLNRGSIYTLAHRRCTLVLSVCVLFYFL